MCVHWSSLPNSLRFIPLNARFDGQIPLCSIGVQPLRGCCPALLLNITYSIVFILLTINCHSIFALKLRFGPDISLRLVRADRRLEKTNEKLEG